MAPKSAHSVLLIKRLTTNRQAQLAAHPSELGVERIQEPVAAPARTSADGVPVNSRSTTNQRR